MEPGPRRKAALRWAGVAAAAALLASCAAWPRETIVAESPPSILLPAAKAGIADGRGRFREIFCAVRDDHGAALPYDRGCEGDAALWRLPDEPPPTGRPVLLGPSSSGLRVVMVPGLLAECVSGLSTVFADARANLEAQGYRTGYIATHGRRGSASNAALIRDAIMAMPDDAPIVLVTHSKGTVDSLEALVRTPALAGRVVALVSVAGAVNGSPIADVVPESLARAAEALRLPSCPPGEGIEAVESLRRSTRLAWLAAHELPAGVRTYSLAAIAAPQDVSAILRPFHATLSRTDPLNDSLVVASDAIVPGSTLLGYPNADHLAVAMPFGADHPVLAATLVTRNDYPRAVLLEAAIRYVEEDLRAHGRRPGR